MIKRLVSGIMLTLLLMGIFTLAFDIQHVESSQPPSTEWNRTYGGAGDDVAHSVVPTLFGGYAVAGYTTSYGAGGADFWLVKVAPDIHDLTVLNVTPFKTVIGQNYSISINVTVENQGNNDENFTLNAYANTTIIDDEYITLTSGDSTIVTLTWNTTGFAYGNYTISAVADTVPGETDTADNTCINGTVFVTIPGDVDGDGDVDPADFYTFSGAYGTSPPSNPDCDIDNDGDVDPGDFYIFSGNYGKSV